ncbi:MAG: hypothetical protein Q8M22_00750 [Actinomycetota bacterium]|nr:hypothetical protein [Actinomycetota bacterium]
MRRLALITTVALLGLAACSSDSSSDGTTAAPDSTTAPTAAAGADTTVAGGESTVSAAGAGSEFCTINSELNDVQLLDGSSTPEQIEEYFTVAFPEALGRLIDATPPELEADVETLVEGVQMVSTVLEENNWDVNMAFADPQLTDVLSTDEFTLAGERVDAYCGG